MSFQPNESLFEKCEQEFESDPMDSMVCDEAAQSDFLWYLDTWADKGVFQSWLNLWLDTPKGKAFMERSVQKLFESRQDAGPEHDE